MAGTRLLYRTSPREVCTFHCNSKRTKDQMNTSESGATLGIADVPFIMGCRKIDRRSLCLVWKEFSEDCPGTDELLKTVQG